MGLSYHTVEHSQSAPRRPLAAALAILLGALLPGAFTPTVAQDLEQIGREQPVKIGGSISARGVAYSVDGITRRRSPFSYALTGSLNVDIYDIAIPLSFTISEQERSLSQPFNQFGASPHYKWITAHLGYRNLSFSPFTLAGHQILGAGVELHPGNFRLGFITGRLERAIEEDTLLNAQTPTYERTGFSGRIGYGSEGSHVDLIVLKAQDDTASLKKAPAGSAVRPAENLVIGASARTTIVQGLSLHADFAVSDYTRDVRSDELNLSADAETLGDVITPRTSTQLYTALTAGLALNIETFNLQASYSRIDPDYQSMGAYYLSNDLESFSIAPSISLLERSLFLNGSIAFQQDNIQRKKRATTSRLTPAVNISYSPSGAFGLTLQFTDVLTTQKAGLLPLSDTTRMDQRTPTFMLSPRYTIDDSLVSHGLYATLSHQSLIDNNRITSIYSEYTSLGVDLSYSLSIPASGTTMNASVSGHRLQNVGGKSATAGFSVGGSQSLSAGALNLNGSFGMSFQEQGNVANASAGAAYRVANHHTFSMNLSLTTAAGIETTNESFTEYTAMLLYGYSF